ncbi:MAG: L-histidine N(alpha)-methyltransferase, partial [Pseudomonadota bacterium]
RTLPRVVQNRTSSCPQLSSSSGKGMIDDAARASLGPSARFILGADLKKDPAILIPAYDDANGVTASFNLNLLARLNRELGATFDLDAFFHQARWNEAEGQVEMHLVAQEPTQATLCGKTFTFAAGETIHTEISRKFELAKFDALLGKSSWSRLHTWTDKRDYYGVMLLGPKLA